MRILRTNLTLLSFLLVVLLGGMLWWLKKEKEPSLPKEFPWEKLAKVTIEDDQGTTTLEKKDNLWILSDKKNLPADKIKTSSLVTTLQKINRRELVSQKKEKQIFFQVEKDKPLLKITFEDGQTLSLIVGKLSYSRGGTFIRFPEKDDVFLVPAYLDSIAVSSGWENLRVADSVSLTIKELALKFSYQNKETVFKKEENEEKIKTFAEQLDYLSGKEVHPQEDKKDQLTKAELTVTLINDQDQQTKFTFFSGKEGFFVQKEGEAFVFTLDKEKYQTILQKAKEILK